MPQNSRNRKLSRAALSAASGIALVLVGSPAVRAGDGDAGGSTFFNKMLNTVGLGEKPGPGIEYQERPPLVVPPSRDLPAPAAAASPSAKNAAWPSDPDATKRSSKQKERSVLTGEAPTGPTSQPDGSQPSGMWDKMTGWTKSITGDSKESATFLHEPSRTTLTDPPAGYRTPAPSQPYGINGSTIKGKSGADKQADMVNGQPTPK